MHGQITLSGISDHDTIFCTYNTRKVKSCNEYVRISDYNSIDLAALASDLEKINWGLLLQSVTVHDEVSLFSDTLTDIMAEHIPIKMVLCKPELTPWINQFILNKMHRRDQAYDRYRKSKLACDRDSYKKARNVVTYTINKAKSTYYNNFFNKCRGDFKTTWRKLKMLGAGNIRADCVTQHTADEFNEYFLNVDKKNHHFTYAKFGVRSL